MNLENWFKVSSSRHEFIFPAFVWWIWLDRNDDIFNVDEPWSVQKVFTIIRHLASEFQKLSSSSNLSSSAISTSWETPPSSIAKKNCDASILSSSNSAGFDCLIRDSSRQWIKGCFGSLPVFLSITRDNTNLTMKGYALVLKIKEVIQHNWVVVVSLI
ncbi:hypothetical protein PIB30_006266 [Stylosanthes scabra]|uniref:Uncharacterized protein n=1 Tax=Stylosanthes scabra TaxID=79078 RepID=A0ABU6Q4A6_9FABA|nr:hypothetical protein [Stylosanthes scabra]